MNDAVGSICLEELRILSCATYSAHLMLSVCLSLRMSTRKCFHSRPFGSEEGRYPISLVDGTTNAISGPIVLTPSADIEALVHLALKDPCFSWDSLPSVTPSLYLQQGRTEEFDDEFILMLS